MADAFIAAATRTPMGALLGDFASLSAPQLGATVIRAAVERAGLPATAVEEVIFGNVLQAGVGQAPARQAALLAGLPESACCTTVHKVCGSGMKAVMLAHDALLADSCAVAVAGGMESMSNAPYLLPRARSGYRLGHGQMLDHMFFDGLEDAYAPEHRGRLMGAFAEDCAEQLGLSRAAQDEFAHSSLQRAQAAQREGRFDWEIAPVSVRDKTGERKVAVDEQPRRAQTEKIPLLKPAFKKNGTVTAANSSSISDGAAALVMLRADTAQTLGVAPLARIVAQVSHAEAPHRFPVAPIGAMQKLFAKTGWQASSVDLFEINEAFAVVTLAAMRAFDLPHDKVNIHGGACALGHPIGASGARIIVTLIGALRQTGGRRGVASLCIGGGEATALAIELL